MRRILILGGTAWLGRELAQQLLVQGESVTCLARGRSGTAPPGAVFVQVDRAEPGAYAAVGHGTWDEVIELSYDVGQVRGALDALSGRADHWTLVSSISVYSSHSEPDADEAAAVVDAGDTRDYAQAKVACERASRAALTDRLLVVRPGLIGGPGDGSDRFGYWVARFALADGQPVLAPSTAGRSVQVIDVRDLAAWMIHAGAAGLTGVINAVGNELALGTVLAEAARTAGSTAEIVEATDEWLLGHDVSYWAGQRSLPLWLPRADNAFAQRSNQAFHRAGGQLRGRAGTLKDTLTDERGRGLGRIRRAGLTRNEELDLLNEL
ncbi:NAD-dependent epimerase/dehydratase family protein [Arthrobacter sp. Br18]|uniref:NAD-dependent epimerase/dehydratase family protein n=1 Tax=Arthrobacter sp. Br18 TaxID=1312954 RepID=UPI00047C17A0|nr:NAD-dependent epimerase/dehydratase family protein [Arthrobacter sp. Br18]